MSHLPSTSKVLAHWTYSNDEWQNFVRYVLNERVRSYRSLRFWIAGIVTGSFLLAGLLILIPYLLLKPWQSIWRADVWGPVIAVFVVTGLIIAAIFVFRLLFADKDRKLRLSTSGDVVITHTAVIVNGSAFDWGCGDSVSRLQSVEQRTVSTAEGGNIEILQFKCSTEYVGVRAIKHTIEKVERIPIPLGKESECQKIIDLLSTETSRSGK